MYCQEMRISRPCYDKPHRCPGWTGGGERYARVNRCPAGGRIPIDYERRGWQLRFHRCPDCRVIVLPWLVCWTSPSWWRRTIRLMVDDLVYFYGR